jgi:hypothetical protein
MSEKLECIIIHVLPDSIKYCSVDKFKWPGNRTVEGIINSSNNWMNIEEYRETFRLPIVVYIYLSVESSSIKDILPEFHSIDTMYIKVTNNICDPPILSFEGIEQIYNLKYLINESKIIIPSLHGIEYCHSIEHIELNSAGITDISSLRGIKLKTLWLLHNPLINISGICAYEMYISTDCLIDLNNDAALAGLQVKYLFACYKSREWVHYDEQRLSLYDEGEKLFNRIAERDDLQIIVQAAKEIQERMRRNDINSAIIFRNDNQYDGHVNLHSLDQILYGYQKQFECIQRILNGDIR